MSPAHGETVVVGVNVVNPQRLSAADRDKVLDQLQAAGVHVIRAPLLPPWGDNDYGPAIDFIHRAYMRGIKTDLIVGLQYREGAQRRPAVRDMPKMWPSYPLSAADPVRFRAVFEPLFDQLESMGIIFAALELGNEINWTAFNGDFPIPGEGRVFGRNDLTTDPEARQIAEGFRAYLQSLRVLKDIRDHSRLNRATPILSAGLSDPGPAGPRPAIQSRRGYDQRNARLPARQWARHVGRCLWRPRLSLGQENCCIPPEPACSKTPSRNAGPRGKASHAG